MYTVVNAHLRMLYSAVGSQKKKKVFTYFDSYLN